MTVSSKNIFPVNFRTITREDKENLLKQKAKVIWMTGLSGAGKTTLAKHLDEALYKKGYLTQILDGDNIRSGINNNLSFSDEDRRENIRRIAEVSKLLLNCGIISICSFISPTESIRNMALDIIGEDNFIEIYVNAPLEVCEQRDVKGLYAKARAGKIKDFTGIDSPFEVPETAHIEVRTDLMTVDDSIDKIMEFIAPEIDNK